MVILVDDMTWRKPCMNKTKAEWIMLMMVDDIWVGQLLEVMQNMTIRHITRPCR